MDGPRGDARAVRDHVRRGRADALEHPADGHGGFQEADVEALVARPRRGLTCERERERQRRERRRRRQRAERQGLEEGGLCQQLGGHEGARGRRAADGRRAEEAAAVVDPRDIAHEVLVSGRGWQMDHLLEVRAVSGPSPCTVD